MSKKMLCVIQNSAGLMPDRTPGSVEILARESCYWTNSSTESSRTVATLCEWGRMTMWAFAALSRLNVGFAKNDILAPQITVVGFGMQVD